MWKSLVFVLGLPLVLWGAKPPAANGIPALDAVRPEIRQAAAKAVAMPHPRLFATAQDFAALKARVATDELVKLGADHLSQVSEALLKVPPCKYEKQGKRLLGVSRCALGRISALAMAYRLTGKRDYLERATKEMLAVCAFPDWNPSHFLDTGEMALAVATGYDWLYNELEPQARQEIARGLRRCGIDAGRRPLWWINAHNNWGQVCHAGMLAAALALAEENPAETGAWIQRCVDRIPISMKALAPKGNYPEGPGYWNYGMEFNAIAIMLLEGTLGSDFGLTQMPGFRETAEYLDIVTGPSGWAFNYADGGAGRGSCFATWWFAKRFNRPDILPYHELAACRRSCANKSGHLAHRLFAHQLLCMAMPSANLPNRQPLVWDAQGPVPIVIQRSSWQPNAMFVGLKGGSPSAPHGHMDGGSFVLDVDGERWASDLGAEDYYGIEKRGMDLWSMGQNSQRWKIYRLGTSSHNTLMLDGQPQLVKGFAKVVSVQEEGRASTATLDLSSLYPNAKRVVRVGTLKADGRTYELADDVEGLREGAPIRWAMITRAKAEIQGNQVVLSQNGKTLKLTQIGENQGKWEIVNAKGPNEWDSPNKHCSQLLFTVSAPKLGAAKLAVRFEAQ